MLWKSNCHRSCWHSIVLRYVSIILCAQQAAAIYKIKLPGASGAGPYEVLKQWASSFEALYPEAEIALDNVGSDEAQKALWGDIDCKNKPIGALCDDDQENKEQEEKRRRSTLWGFGDLAFAKNAYLDHSSLQLQQLPSAAGAVLPIMSSTISTNNITLTMDDIAGIFNASIIYWDDPSLRKLNPDVNLPHKKITVVVRKDSSGQTCMLTASLLRNVPTWPKDITGRLPDWNLHRFKNTNSSTESWESFTDGSNAISSSSQDCESECKADGTNGVVSLVLRNPWSIGYIEMGHYAKFDNYLSEVKVGNSSASVTASVNSIAKTMNNTANSFDPVTLKMQISSNTPQEGYPIIGYSYWYLKMNASSTFQDCHQAWLIKKFIEWSYSDPHAAKIARDEGWIVLQTPSLLKIIRQKLSEVMMCIDNLNNTIPVGTFTPPNYQHNPNLIDQGLVVMGYVCFGIVSSLALCCTCWLWHYRNKWIVKASQPALLWGVVAGCFIWSFCLPFQGVQSEYGIPGGDDHQQEDTSFVDAACKAVTWFYGIGFGLTFSMLLAKILRVKMIFEAAQRRGANNKSFTTVSFKKVSPIVILILFVEITFLICWQVLDPVHWEREVLLEVDGILLESYGKCTSEHYITWHSAMGTFNLVCLIYGVVLCVQTRNIDSDFAESKYISLTIAFMFEMLVLLIPILIMVQDTSPSASYFVLTISDFFQISGILALLFIPKMVRLKIDDKTAKKKKMSIRLSALTSSNRDEAVDTINGLLLQDSRTYAVMTDQQRLDLEKAKILLLEGAQEEKEKRLLYIPKKVLVRRSSKLASTCPPVNKVDYNTACFIMKEYGGIDMESEESGSFRRSLRRSGTVDNNNCHNKFSREVFILPEFQNLPRKAKHKVREMLSWRSLSSWDFNIFQFLEVSGGNPLLFIGWAVLGSPHSQNAMAAACDDCKEGCNTDGYNFMESHLQIPMDVLCNYLRVMQEDYRSDNPFHNEIHAADVLQSLHVLIQMTKVDGSVFFSVEELFSVLLSAAVHDVDHPGKNNAFQTNTMTDLALIYNDVSVLENKHASHAFITMLGDEGAILSVRRRRSSFINHGKNRSGVNVLRHATAKDTANVRHKTVDAILHTDMTKHFGLVNALKAMYLKNNDTQNLSSENRWKLLIYMLHLADISGQARADPLFLEWTDRLMEEFFTQGDKEASLGLPVSELCDRQKTNIADVQFGFIEFVILPSYEVLAEFIPDIRVAILPNIQKNFQYWAREKGKEDLTTKENTEQNENV